MNIALIGYGRMGQEIEAIAIKRGHNVKLTVDKDNENDLNDVNLKDIHVAIEFSSPTAAFLNISKCLNLSVPVVSGTTGWNYNYGEVKKMCDTNKTSFIYSSNFSIGVNLFFRMSNELAKQMEPYGEYSASIEEIHHTKKLDAPSGTAITLAGGIVENHARYEKWCFEENKTESGVPIHSIREGEVPGTHIVTWDSEIDTISIKHEARNRKGFALGAVIAAEYISNRIGVFTMGDVMGF